MYIARILYPVMTLGPGKRVAVWTCGCPHKCEGCANPELWSLDDKKDVSLSVIADLISQIVSQNAVDGFTITGGEPFFQYEELKELLELLSKWSDDILVFTGYYMNELSDRSLDHIAVLIDGPYIKRRNYGLTLRGSDNQGIHILDQRYRAAYQEYLKDSNSKIQNFTDGSSVISVGIHRPDYSDKLDACLREKGIIPGGT